MLSLYVRTRDFVSHVGRDESGQDAMEYLLVVGVIMVAVVGAVAAGFTPTGLIATIVTKITTKVTTLIG